MNTTILLISIFFSVLPFAFGDLRVGFYSSSCPRAELIVHQVVERSFNQDRSITAALLRMHFHDCFVRVSPLTNIIIYNFFSILLKNFIPIPLYMIKVLNRDIHAFKNFNYKISIAKAKKETVIINGRKINKLRIKTKNSNIKINL
jgi:hypothetical protein